MSTEYFGIKVLWKIIDVEEPFGISLETSSRPNVFLPLRIARKRADATPLWAAENKIHKQVDRRLRNKENRLQRVVFRTSYLYDSLSDVHLRLCSLEEKFLKHSHSIHLEACQESINTLLHKIRTGVISDFLIPRYRLIDVNNAEYSSVMRFYQI